MMTLADRIKEEGRQEVRQEVTTLAERIKEEGRQEVRQEMVTVTQKVREESWQEGRNQTVEKIATLVKQGMPIEQILQGAV